MDMKKRFRILITDGQYVFKHTVKLTSDIGFGQSREGGRGDILGAGGERSLW